VNEAKIAFVLENPEVVSTKVYNSLGAIVYKTEPIEFSAGNQSLTFERNDLESGVYFINIQSGNNYFTEKVILK
jgi:hypothetical protein